MNSSEQPRRRGIVPNKRFRCHNVILEEDLADWAKQQPSGLSAWLRRLLKLSFERSGRKQR